MVPGGLLFFSFVGIPQHLFTTTKKLPFDATIASHNNSSYSYNSREREHSKPAPVRLHTYTMWQSTATVCASLPSQQTHLLQLPNVKGEFLPDIAEEDGIYHDDDYYHYDVPFLLEDEPENYDTVFGNDGYGDQIWTAKTRTVPTLTPTATANPALLPRNHLTAQGKYPVSDDFVKKSPNESQMVDSNFPKGIGQVSNTGKISTNTTRTDTADINVAVVLQKHLPPTTSSMPIKKHLCVPPERKPRRTYKKKKSNTTKPSSSQQQKKQNNKADVQHKECKNNKAIPLKKKERNVKTKLKKKTMFGGKVIDEHDRWNRSFLDFINLHSRTIREQTGQPLSRRQMRTWERQKISKIAVTTSIGQQQHQHPHPQHHHGNNKMNSRQSRCSTPAAVMPSGEDRVMIRMNEQTRTMILFDSDETTYQLGLWVQEQRQQYHKHRIEHPEPPLSFQECGRKHRGTPTNISHPSLNPCNDDAATPKQDNDDDDAQTKAAWEKESEACYEYLEQSFRFHLLELVGLQMEMSPEETIVQRKYFAPLPV